MTDEPVDCPWCHHEVFPLPIAGHVACPVCRQVIEACCTGESAAIAAESEEPS